MTASPAPTAAPAPAHSAFERPIDTDVLVVGGGIAGCASAYYLARAGADVVLIEREDVSTQASGMNAGSIHSQMSFTTFNARSAEWIAYYAPVLPFLKQSILTWQEVAAESGTDFDLVTEGGLMVAETPAQMELLKRKVEIENRNGIESRVIGANELFRLAPYITRKMIGAEFCPLEGKIDPLLATFAVARLAVQAGARIKRFAGLEHLEHSDGRWQARTARGTVRAARVVIAAGGWCGDIAAKVGVPLPAGGQPIHMNVTEPADFGVDHLIYTAGQKLTFKQGKHGHLIIGGGWPATLDPRTGRPVSLRTTVEANLWTAMQVAPDVGHLRVLRTWAGMVNETPDGRPIIGPVPGRPGLYVNTFPGMGYTAGPFSGKLLSEIVLGKTPSFDPAIGAVERFDGKV